MSQVQMLSRRVARTHSLLINSIILVIVAILLYAESCVGSMATQNDFTYNASIRIDEVAQRYMDANGDEFIETLWRLQHDKDSFKRKEAAKLTDCNNNEQVCVWVSDTNDTIVYNKLTRTLKINDLLLALTSDNPAHFARDENAAKTVHHKVDSYDNQHVLTAALGNYPSPDSARPVTLFVMLLSILPLLTIIVFTASGV